MTIKNKDIYMQIGNLEGKVDSLINDVKAIRKTSDKKIGHLSEKINNLEKKQYTLITIASGLFAILIAGVKRLFDI